jgi:hypothetical protein
MAYFAIQQGPAPKALIPIRDDLLKECAISIEKRPMGNRTQDRVVPLREPYLDLFTKNELALVDEVIAELWDQSADEASNASHDIRWRTLNLKDDIPYEAVFLSDKEITENDIQRTRELAHEFGWK